MPRSLRAPLRATTRPAELVQIAVVARRHYLEGRSKSEIADEFGLSRFKVARILEEAQSRGIVRIEVTLDATLDAALSDELAGALGLRRAIVVSTPDESQLALRPRLGEVVGDLLTELVVPGDVLGLAWGRTLTAMAASLSRLAPCNVVQLNGVASPAGEGSVELVRQVASISGGRAYPIYAPLVVSDVATAETLRREPGVAAAFRMHDEVTKAVVAIGSWDPPYSTVYDAIGPDEREQLRRLGVRAEVCASMLDADGREVPNDLTPRVIGVPLARLRSYPEVIAVAGGPLKAQAIKAVVRAGCVTTLVTDSSAARHILQSTD